MTTQTRRPIASISTLGTSLALLMVTFVLLVTNVSVTHAQVDTINVATTGVDDADCGTEADPCRTIPYAVTKAVAGDLVFVHLEPISIRSR